MSILPRCATRWCFCAGLILALVFLGACSSSSGGDNTTSTNGSGSTTSSGSGGSSGSSSSGSSSSSPGGSGPGSTDSTSGSGSSSGTTTGSSGSGSTGSGGTGGGTGGGGTSGGNVTVATAGTNVAVACSTTGDDSTQNADGSAKIVRSYTVGSPTYHMVVSRRDYLNRTVWLDYMVHEPTDPPKGIVVLIAGGAMNANITGTEGNTPVSSGKNYLVRSAHRYANAGYRVITMDRPSDYTMYGQIDTSGYLYDAYRTSMDHAIDITTIVNRENKEDLPVFIAGTSRGAISAVAQNTLAAGIDISSPVTSGNGTAVGTANFPVTQVQVPVHLLYHQNDGCTVSVPANSASLFDQFIASNIEVTGNNVSGGFADLLANNPCGALDYHGYTGIENCAVNTSTTWMDDELTVMEANHPGNARPVAQAQTVSATMGQAIDITLSATDSDDTTFTYALPFTTSSLGGTLSISDHTVTYTAPVDGYIANTADSFVFTVTDSKGSRSAAIIKIDLSQAPVDHATFVDPCSTCHNLPPETIHQAYKSECDVCHITTQWNSYTFNHAGITIGSGNCSVCHDGKTATGKSDKHITTQQECDVCHASTTNWYNLP